jgi:hypothetical protein
MEITQRDVLKMEDELLKVSTMTEDEACEAYKVDSKAEAIITIVEYYIYIGD